MVNVTCNDLQSIIESTLTYRGLLTLLCTSRKPESTLGKTGMRSQPFRTWRIKNYWNSTSILANRQSGT